MQIKPRVRIVGADRHQLAQQLVGRYRSGESIRALASSIGRSYGFVHALLEEAGAEIRDRGGDRRTRRAETEASY